VYLPGEAGEEDEDGNSDVGDYKDELVYVSVGKKRKLDAGSMTTKFPKTKARFAASIAALSVIDDRRPDITLVDLPVDEGTLSLPYGRHSCLFVEMKVGANMKPNPQEVGWPLSVDFLVADGVAS
jgi:hypothetical protein